MKRLLAALACGLLALSACSDDSSSSADPPPSPSPVTSSTPSTGGGESESPEDFVRRWVEADTDMQVTGDSSLYRELSRKCSACKEYADFIEGIWDAGGYIKTRGWVIKKSKTSRAAQDGSLQVTINVTSTPADFVEQKGGPVKHYDAQDLTYIIDLTPSSSSWVATNFSQVAQ